VPALLSTQTGEAHRAAQFPGLCVLAACDVDALLDGRLGIAHRPGAGEECLAPEPIELGFKRRSPRLFDRIQPGGDRRKRRFGFADRQLRMLLADLQCPFGTVGDRRWLVAKDVNGGNPRQCLGEGHRVPERQIAVESYALPDVFHRDPADRLIVATARVANATLMTRDQRILDYAARGHLTAIAA